MFAWDAISVALLVAAVALGIVCLVLPKVLGAVPLTILSGSMAPTMPAGALAVVRPVDATQARVGDVLCYQPEPDDPTLVTHRVIAVSTDAHGDVSLTLQGDANGAPDERPVDPEQVRGAVVYAVPYFGRIASRLNVGAGERYTRWAAYALIGVGSLRMLLGLVAARQRPRTTDDGGRSGGSTAAPFLVRAEWTGFRACWLRKTPIPPQTRHGASRAAERSADGGADATRHRDKRTTTNDRSDPRRPFRGADP